MSLHAGPRAAPLAAADSSHSRGPLRRRAARDPPQEGSVSSCRGLEAGFPGGLRLQRLDAKPRTACRPRSCLGALRTVMPASPERPSARRGAAQRAFARGATGAAMAGRRGAVPALRHQAPVPRSRGGTARCAVRHSEPSADGRAPARIARNCARSGPRYRRPGPLRRASGSGDATTPAARHRWAHRPAARSCASTSCRSRPARVTVTTGSSIGTVERMRMFGLPGTCARVEGYSHAAIGDRGVALEDTRPRGTRTPPASAESSVSGITTSIGLPIQTAPCGRPMVKADDSRASPSRNRLAAKRGDCKMGCNWQSKVRHILT